MTKARGEISKTAEYLISMFRWPRKSERMSSKSSPQSEPTQKPKVTMNMDVRAAISARRS